MKLFITALIFWPTALWAALVDPKLRAFAHQSGGTVKVIVLMDQQTTMSLPMTSDRRGVYNFTVSQTQASWARIQPALAAAIAQHAIQPLSMHSISQSFSANVTPAGLRLLATTSGISKIYANGQIFQEPTLRRSAAFAPHLAGSNLPYDLTIIGMDKVIQENPTITGAGVIIGHVDTGVDGTHPAVAGKIALFYDASQKKTMPAHDTDEHGTHTAGTMVGAPHNGAPMGMAPGARLVSAAGLTGYDDMIVAMQFMLNPAAEVGAGASNLLPRLVSNSWNCGGAPDVEVFYRAIAAWEAAGILPVFSAGNSGPSAASITPPHEDPDTEAVGAFGANGIIADFSSRGPGNYHGQSIMKPDVAAPGVDIVSSVPGGKYESMSGTSMAAPHVGGLSALLFQVNPALTPMKIREILAKSADYVDMDGKSIPAMQWNANYGYGRINAYKAVAMAKTMVSAFLNRFGSMLSPSVGFLPPLNPAIGAPAPAVQLVRAYVTDRRQWIDGNQL